MKKSNILLGFTSSLAILIAAGDAIAQQSLPPIQVVSAKKNVGKPKPKKTTSANLGTAAGNETGNATVTTNLPYTPVPTIQTQGTDQVPLMAVNGSKYEVVQQYLSEQFLNTYHIQETSPGQQSPYIGAFTGNQVEQTVNGIRTSNALFRSGPNQYYGWVPDAFTKEVNVSDGGNVGGTINRELGVIKNQAYSTYYGANNGFDNVFTYKFDNKYSFGISNKDYGNVRTARGINPYSHYNQLGLFGQIEWTPDQKTTVVYSESTNLPRTDKWVGGMKASYANLPNPDNWAATWKNPFVTIGPATAQLPGIYTWDLQRYTYVNHESNWGPLKTNVGYQNSQENIQDGTKKIHSNLNQFIAYGDLDLGKGFSLYTANTYEGIQYDNGNIGLKNLNNKFDNTGWGTFREGGRWKGYVGPIELALSGGYKTVTVTGINRTYNAPEASAIASWKGLFFSYDKTANAPSYFQLKQAITAGVGTQLPNDKLAMEWADTYRVGYKWKGLYMDVYRKDLHDSFANVAVTTPTCAVNCFRVENAGGMATTGFTFAYDNPNVFDTGVSFYSRIEYVYGAQWMNSYVNMWPTKVPPLITYAKVGWQGLWLEHKFQTKNALVNTQDLIDVRTYAFNTGYNLLNVGYTGQWQNMEYTIAVNNLFNNAGRVWGSSVDVPGRNVMATVRWNF